MYIEKFSFTWNKVINKLLFLSIQLNDAIIRNICMYVYLNTLWMNTFTYVGLLFISYPYHSMSHHIMWARSLTKKTGPNRKALRHCGIRLPSTASSLSLARFRPPPVRESRDFLLPKTLCVPPLNHNTYHKISLISFQERPIRRFMF